MSKEPKFFKDVCLLVANVQTPSGTIYPDAVVKDLFERYKELPIPGQIGTPSDDATVITIDLNKMAVMTYIHSYENDRLVADIIVLPTPEGDKITKLIETTNFDFHSMFKLCGLATFKDEENTEMTSYFLCQVNLILKDL